MLVSGIVTVNRPGSKKSLIKALEKLAEIDNDFNGENGIAFTSRTAIERGYNSDCEYVLSRAKEMKNERAIVELFVRMLFRDDYYKEYKVNCGFNKRKKITAISYSFITE